MLDDKMLEEIKKIKERTAQKQIQAKSLSEVERSSRQRHLEAENSQDNELRAINDAAAVLNSQGFKVVAERKHKNKAKFVQFIQKNINYLMETEYLTNQEWMFLLRITGYIGIESNCIVFDIDAKHPIPMSQADIAKAIGSSSTRVSAIVKGLVDKGIISKTESGKENVNARMYSLHVNPNIIVSGNKDTVNETLKTMFRKVPKALKDLPEKII